MRLNGASLALAACLVLLGTGSAIAAHGGGDSNDSLKGKFRFSLTKTCTDTATASLVHIYFSGVITYDGNGQASLKERGTIFLPVFGPLVYDTFEDTADLTYEVKPNGSFTQEGIFTATDGSYTLTGAKVVGQIDAQGSVLILSAAIPPVEETLVFTGGGSSSRYCGASGTAARIR